MNFKINQKDFTGQDQNSELNKNFIWSLESTQKQNTPILSNYSSSISMNVPKEIMQKTIQAKNQHINELMEELKQAKSSYQQFKVKLSAQNSKLKEQNLTLKQKLDPLIKQKDYLKKSIIKLQQQKNLHSEKVKSFHQENHLTITELTRKIDQLQEENKKVQKSFIQQQKISQQLKHQRDQSEAKIINLQKQLQFLRTQQSLEIQKLKDAQIKLSQQNASLKEELEKFQQRTKNSKKYDKKLSRLQEKIACIIDNI